jgi:hypothetical protein
VYGRRPLTRLEAALYVVATGVLVAVLLDRMLEYFEIAERATVEATVNRVNSGINTRLAYDRLKGRISDPEEWLRRNPFELVSMNPANFLGEVDRAEPSAVPPGQWVYDRGTAQLLYRPRFSRHLQTRNGSKLLRFQVRPMGVNAYGPYHLVPSVAYEWGAF